LHQSEEKCKAIMVMSSSTIHNITMVPQNFIYKLGMTDQAVFFVFYENGCPACRSIISGSCEER
jgi:hypothetical protein